MINQRYIDKWVALLICALGFTAISAIACHVLGWCDLYLSSRFIVFPAFAAILIFSLHNQELGRKVLKGWIYGIIAVGIYDMSRVPFMLAGWGDFIPTIGDWVLGENDVHPLVGYGWRYIGNGGGLGIAFVVFNEYFRVKLNKVLFGLIYGVGVFLCLDIVLATTPEAQALMFKLTTLNVTGSVVGHVVFGTVLGMLYHYNAPLTVQASSPLISE